MAEADLRGLLQYTQRLRGNEVAILLNRRLRASFTALATTPGLGHLREDLTDKPYFFHQAGPYLIVYVRDREPLVILAVFHGARDLESLLDTR